MTTRQPEALLFAEDRPTSICDDLHQWAMDAEAVIRAQHARIAELEDDLQFVERWAVHHGSKPSISAEEALSCIQHYPAIHEITKSYKDGKRPDTFNPYARIAKLEAALVKEAARTASEKRRADQMSQQHDMQAALNRDAREQLAALAATHPAAQGMDVVQAAKALCKHAAKVQNVNFDDYWLIHAEEFKEEAQIVLDAAQAKQDK